MPPICRITPLDHQQHCTHLNTVLIHSLHSFYCLPYDISRASSKANSPHSAIYSFLLQMRVSSPFLNPLNAELNPICHLLALLGAHPILHISRIRVKVIQ